MNPHVGGRPRFPRVGQSNRDLCDAGLSLPTGRARSGPRRLGPFALPAFGPGRLFRSPTECFKIEEFAMRPVSGCALRPGSAKFELWRMWQKA